MVAEAGTRERLMAPEREDCIGIGSGGMSGGMAARMAAAMAARMAARTAARMAARAAARMAAGMGANPMHHSHWTRASKPLEAPCEWL